jgi:triacylglycerol lipase
MTASTRAQVPTPAALRAFLAFLIVLGLISCVSAPTGAAPLPPDLPETIDFAPLERFSEAYRVMRYEPDAVIRATIGAAYDSFELVDLPATRNRYMLGTLDSAKRQEIWIRGTANFRNALYDLEYGKHHNDRLGINLHTGFEAMALAVYRDILPRLRHDCDLVIFGHSLGAAEAVILAMLLDADGYRVKQVYASGQPRVTDQAGEAKFDYLPILRIVNYGDPVPSLPPRGIVSAAAPYTHLGPMVLLLDGPAYCLIREDVSDETLASGFWELLSQEGVSHEVKDHMIPAYLARIDAKLAAPVRVPFADRAAYVGKAANGNR